MSNYLTDAEAIVYGRLAVDRIVAHCRGLDPNADASLDAFVHELAERTEALAEASQTAAKPGPLFQEEEGIVADAQAALTRAVHFLKSKQDGVAVITEMLAGNTLTKIKRRRPVLLVEALERAVSALQSVDSADEHTLELMAHAEKLSALIERVQHAKAEQRLALRRLRATRSAWLVAYRAAKRFVRAVLTNQGHAELLVQVFQDRAGSRRKVEALAS